MDRKKSKRASPGLTGDLKPPLAKKARLSDSDKKVPRSDRQLQDTPRHASADQPSPRHSPQDHVVTAQELLSEQLEPPQLDQNPLGLAPHRSGLSRVQEYINSLQEDYEQEGERQLTRGNIRLLRKMTQRPSESDEISNFSSSTGTTNNSGKSLSSASSPGIANEGFEQGILCPYSSKEASNLEDLRARFEKPRDSPEPSNREFKGYCGVIGEATNKATLIDVVGHYLLKWEPEPSYKKVLKQQCTRFPINLGFNNGLSPPKPDIMFGFSQRSYYPFKIYGRLGDRGALLYYGPNPIALPHFAGEFQRTGEPTYIAVSQSAYHGACFVYGRNQALKCAADQAKDAAVPSNDAAVITFTSDGKEISFFGHFATKSEKLGVNYHQCLIASENLVNSCDSFKRARRMIRNAQEFAKDEAQKLRTQLVALKEVSVPVSHHRHSVVAEL